MKLRAAPIVTALGLLGSPAVAQQPLVPAQEARKSPVQLFELAQNQIAVGRFDAAGETLKLFQASNPTPADYRAITDREPTAFLKLRFNIPVWSENAAADQDYKKVVAELATASAAASKEFSRDPARINRFVRNLEQSEGERIFAIEQLKLSGDGVVAPLVNAIRTANDPSRQARVVSAISRLNPGQLPGILTSSLGLGVNERLAILRAAVDRPDAQTLSNAPDTDLLPYLWYYAASRGEELRALREFAALTLDSWTRSKSQATNGQTELVRISQPLARNQGRYRGDDPVKLWQFDESTQTPISRDATPAQANDFYALRNLRWALERNPGNPAAIELFLATAIERAVEAAQFGNVLQADPDLLPILASADSATLNSILTQALDAKRTALALGATQILAARFDKDAAKGPFLQALDYPDARVQLAAAIGLLKVPGSVPGAKAARIVDILRRAAAVEAPPEGKTELGRAFVADPSDRRGARLARYLKDLGYGTERFATGRQLATRLRAASDADLIFVDRHVGDPVIGDLLSSLRADRDTVSRPVFLVASDDYARPLPLDRLLLRLATLVAVADTNPAKPPEPFRYDPIRRLRPDEVDVAREKLIEARDGTYLQLYKQRLAQLERLVAGADLPRSQTLQAYLEIRLPQLTLAALDAEYPYTAVTAPKTAAILTERTRTLLLNPRLQNATTDLRTDRLARISEDVDNALDPERRATFEKMLARIDADALLIPRDDSPNTAIDDKLERIARVVGGVNVIAEPSSALALSDDIDKAATDPARKPVPAAVKRQNAKLAVEYLRRMAVGEITGFDVRPAETALRAALRDDEFAMMAADAVARFGTPEAQQDLIGTALGIGRPMPIRLHAADRAIQNVETFGRLAPPAQVQALSQQAESEKDPALKSRLAVLNQITAARPANISELIQKFPLPLPPEPKKAEAAPKPATPPGPIAEPGKN